MESDDDITLSMVEGKLTHLKSKKVNDEECKYPMAWWKTHLTIFLCWVCSSTNLGDCGILD
jgi:hypothetical protein